MKIPIQNTIQNTNTSKPPQCPILSFWILNLNIIICQFKKIHRDTFFLSHCTFLPLVPINYIFRFVQTIIHHDCEAVLKMIMACHSCLILAIYIYYRNEGTNLDKKDFILIGNLTFCCWLWKVAVTIPWAGHNLERKKKDKKTKKKKEWKNSLTSIHQDNHRQRKCKWQTRNY